MADRITVIPKKIVTVIEPHKSTLVDREKYRQTRVAAYCRVSTDSEEQLTSYKTQKKVYTDMIAARKDWSLVDIYADEAVIIGLKPPSTNGRRFSPISITGHFPILHEDMLLLRKRRKTEYSRTRRSLISAGRRTPFAISESRRYL